ncbi:mannose-1-phosphate guanylyltransferase [Taibaiella chishuiensis]|uniref:Mannose-1-phosphate guanylyltransferase n=1 Tax=Taibaiella chishuiensis TaxID=1434707 RepID=A0A2P8D2P3_9BACT|nr:mannose-1-phosphate guanylyltransferase [Taibaiella chishuiensis]
MSLIHVILSGGVGSRLWPLSRKSRPKQYIPLFEGKTLFQLCAMRNRELCDRQLVVGNINNYKLSRKNMEGLGYGDYQSIIEYWPRNTAAAIVFAALSCDPEDVLLVTPSDHVIDGVPAYTEAVTEAVRLAGENNLVTFGIRPDRPETGYGYIEFEGNDVKSFREKPDYETASSFVQSGRFLWNSGMFCFKAGVFLEELGLYQPELLAAARQAWENKSYDFLPDEQSRMIPALSVDYAVMEHSQRLKVVPATFTWSDLGSFGALWDYKESRGKKQPEPGRGNNLVLGSSKHVEFIGMENMILVETEDAILVLPREKSQEVKNVYERLEQEKPELLK